MGDDQESAIALIECNGTLYIADHVKSVHAHPHVYFNDASTRQQAAFVSNAKVELLSLCVLCSVCTGDSCMGNYQVRDSDNTSGNCTCFGQSRLVASNITFIFRLQMSINRMPSPVRL